MKPTMIATALSTALALGAMLGTAHADTWVFRDTLRPGGHDRGMAAKRADGRTCGASRSGRAFATASSETFRECMSARGWALDHVIPEPPSAYARAPGYESPPPIDNSASDDLAARQRDQTQQMVNQQQQNDIQQQNMNQFDQQQQIINNNRLSD